MTNQCVLECIFTYYNRNQDIGSVDFTLNDNMTENDFLLNIFDLFFHSDDDLNQLDDLNKISCCLYNYDGKKDTIFMRNFLRNNGKYLFDKDDPNIISHIKNNYVSNRKKLINMDNQTQNNEHKKI